MIMFGGPEGYRRVAASPGREGARPPATLRSAGGRGAPPARFFRMSKLSAPPAILDRYPPAKRIRRRAKWARVRASYHAHQRFLGNPSSSRRFVDDPPELTEAQGEALAELRS